MGNYIKKKHLLKIYSFVILFFYFRLLQVCFIFGTISFSIKSGTGTKNDDFCAKEQNYVVHMMGPSKRASAKQEYRQVLIFAWSRTYFHFSDNFMATGISCKCIDFMSKKFIRLKTVDGQ